VLGGVNTIFSKHWGGGDVDGIHDQKGSTGTGNEWSRLLSVPGYEALPNMTSGPGLERTDPGTTFHPISSSLGT